MRKLVAGLFISLDGVVESPGEWGFRYMDAAMAQRMAEGIAQADAILLGRETYTLFHGLWAHQGDSSPMATFLNRTPKFVVSQTLKELPWEPARLLSGDLVEEVSRLKNQPGKNIQVPGSPRLVAALLTAGLLDELTLSICPVVVGKGRRLFEDDHTELKLELVGVETSATGAIGATYRRAEPA